jgi:hypothetical protein
LYHNYHTSQLLFTKPPAVQLQAACGMPPPPLPNRPKKQPTTFAELHTIITTKGRQALGKLTTAASFSPIELHTRCAPGTSAAAGKTQQQRLYQPVSTI